MTYPGHTSGTVLPGSLSMSGASAAPVPAALPSATAPSRPARAERFFQARPVMRRIVYALGYETLSVLFTVVVMSGLLGHGGGQSTLTAVLLSTTATVWNYVWNAVFESLERRIGATGRGPVARALHAVGYEGGVLVFTIPLVAVMLGVSLLEAAMIESGMLLFFLVFTAVYAWAFDRIFGLPASVR